MRVAVGLCVLFAGFSAVLSRSFEYVHLEPGQSTSIPEGWTRIERVAPDEDLKLTFALKQQNVDVLEDLFWKVSDPTHEEYGHYLSLHEIADIVKPSNETVAEVERWLEGSGVTDCSTIITEDFLECSMPARTAENLLGDIKFHRYTDGKRRVIRSEVRYLVPRHLKDHLDFVGGVHRFPPGLKLKTAESKNISSPQHIGNYPTVIRERYNISKEVGGKHEANSQCTPQFLEQYYHQGDLDLFWRLYGKGYVHRDEIDKVVGEVPGGLSGIEASLDTQYIMSTGNNITTWFWYTAGRHEQQEPFLQWLIDLSDMENAPLVNSASYSDKERTVDPDYMNRINTEFMKAGVRGLTLLFASGDDGAGCHDNKHFEPQFPSTSPYVTTVGGTAFIKPFGIGEEQGYDISGGGFSNFFDAPDYQKELVDKYFKMSDPEKMPPASYYNRVGRGYPDIAAVSNHYWVVNNIVPVPGVLGTSASCPVVAGILAHLNDHRLAAGLPPLGFVNPFLYQNPETLTDVSKHLFLTF
ncbi:tripeptidyl-peptidase 1-like [Branchiostoma lanceolatum]|uniref:tripeptidyl-peptidase 1-like n=1 Tax=Branchiostoma lanceolatum TaxID=7740 RepID=UPI003454F854